MWSRRRSSPVRSAFRSGSGSTAARGTRRPDAHPAQGPRGRVLEHGVRGYDLSTLVEADTGTSVTPPELLAAIKDALPNTVTRVFYGSTEAGPTLALADVDLARKPGSVGVAQPGVEVRLDE